MQDEASYSISKMPEGFITRRGVAHAQNSQEERVVVAMATNYTCRPDPPPPPRHLNRCDVTSDKRATPIPQYTFKKVRYIKYTKLPGKRPAGSGAFCFLFSKRPTPPPTQTQRCRCVT
jgi:hypothetical protein